MNRRQIAGIIGIFAALIIVPLIVWGIVAYTQRGTEEVSLNILPYDGTVLIDNKDISGSDSIRLTPGVYSVKVEQSGFEPKTQEFEVTEGGVNTVVVSLTPNSDEGWAWIDAHPEEYQELEAAAGQAALERGQQLIEDYPLIEELPIQKAIYSIGYMRSEGDGVIITISTGEGYREAALQEIRDLGYDPGDYIIEFKDYENPFDE